jgi:ATP-dependent exoDNAse (exonuclease V) beta subunit
MSSIVLVKKPDDIDLDRHGVIEAHAGTGKTHAIVQMVLRILERTVAETGKDKPRFIHIREILLVTFTEKAAGELKNRIRKALEERVAVHEDREVKEHLADCLNNLHEALIGTIHGICLRLLQTWPFETGVHFVTEMVDDSEGLADALRESMRTAWQDPQTGIPWALEQLQNQGVLLQETHFGCVQNIAKELLDGSVTVLDRRYVGGLTVPQLRCVLDGTTTDCAARRDLLVMLTQCIEIYKGIAAAPQGLFNEGMLAELQRRADSWENQIRENRIEPHAFIRLKTFNEGKNRFSSPKTQKHPRFKELKTFHECIPSHVFFRILRGETLLLTLLCDAGELLSTLWLDTKREKGLISFQDMLRLMHRAVAANQGFCTSLRSRLRFGIIDEFQDTSILQWEIFKKIFLETTDEKAPRLFVVGDPKQSIYGFQGADVQSYLTAKDAIVKKHGRVYGLVENYRSLKETIDGYNSILAQEGNGPDWFAFDAISYSSDGGKNTIAKVPEKRMEKPQYPLPAHAVQLMVLEGNAGARRTAMAQSASRVIRSLVGKTISVPDGLTWKDMTLDYRDFAVIVEAHGLAEPFLERFQSDGIPAVKYKMEGVFQSPVARDLHAVLRAILHPAGDPAPRLAALLTRFFNRNPAELDPEKDLEPCQNPHEDCTQGDSCIFHALEEWTSLAAKHCWSQLFDRLQNRCRIRERLVRLADGQRHLADLRQVTDYCIEKLYRGNFSLETLVEHLGRLLAEEETVGQDRNLFALATDKSSVRVLTMHAAKGLEFPIVFLATGGSGRKGKATGLLSWITDQGTRHVMPMESVTDTGTDFTSLFEKEMRQISSWNVTKGKDRNDLPHLEITQETLPLPDVQRIQERRRLLYVALTRAQAILFVPVHLKEPDEKNTPVGWSGRALPSYFPDTDLSPRLLHLLQENKVDRFDIALPIWSSTDPVKTSQRKGPFTAGANLAESVRNASDEIGVEISALDLANRICRQTSYTELSRQADSDRTIDRSEEDYEASGPSNRQDSALPGSARTGNALHLAIEEILKAPDIATLIHNIQSVTSIVRNYLERGGILRSLTSAALQTRALEYATLCVQCALTTPLPLPQGPAVTIADLKPGDRIAEMEFFLSMSPHWIHGYMDLVLRIENKGAAHPWRYFVLDWKSDRLDNFDRRSMAARIHERHYDLQAKIYCHALDKYLMGILGHGYDPAQNLGGALYVFLRSFQDSKAIDACHCWTRQAEPKEDLDFASEQILNLTGRNAR